MWWIGDWWAFGDHKYGERAAQATEGRRRREAGTAICEGSGKARGGRPRKGEKKPGANWPEVLKRSREKAAKMTGTSGRSVGLVPPVLDDTPTLADLGLDKKTASLLPGTWAGLRAILTAQTRPSGALKHLHCT